MTTDTAVHTLIDLLLIVLVLMLYIPAIYNRICDWEDKIREKVKRRLKNENTKSL